MTELPARVHIHTLFDCLGGHPSSRLQQSLLDSTSRDPFRLAPIYLMYTSNLAIFV